MLVHQRVENLLAQARDVFGLRRRGIGRRGPLEGADDADRVAVHRQLEAERSALRIAPLHGQQAELTDREPQIFEITGLTNVFTIADSLQAAGAP